ncbi:DUF3488 and transglutaminase-like domain-containing protein [Pelomonas sp. SE-A7]|uniref:DUF3488 and transglutaminase-like domain-containing protein n=1 Tax=Pelomonas sp. SE-A7 TaxID=3054953 RepID=UPI00259CBB3C|nr:DUF3488 and transglutaminase-like domain-containing protein [Pelomonas sp. SE-A7]MDM4765670.1 DUF3488 and transglutaminase-like domain-containing protein [Pelomonas sp. SE-A7]
MSLISERLARLPRETRDTLFLLLTITATVAPHADHLPLWCSALTALMLLWRAQLAWRGASLPGRWPLVGLLVITAGLTWLSYRSLLGREPGITLLTLLMALKTLELRARRDAFVVFFLGFFLVLTSFLYSQSLLTAVWMLLCVWALLSALVLAQMPIGQPSLLLAARQAARTTLLGLPLMLALFFLFPRIAPLWGIPADAVGKTGLSNRLDFGAMSEIANDDSIAMRLRFEGPAPPSSALYFRGPVLSDFDGRSWRPSNRVFPLREAAPRVSGRATSVEVTLEPLRIPVLPLLELGSEAPNAIWTLDQLTLRRGVDLQWLADRPVTERLRFTHQVWLQHEHGPLKTSGALSEYVVLPLNRNPRSLAWARQLKASLGPEATAQARVDAVLSHIRTNDFNYTLEPGRYGELTPHLIDEFWFDRRLGFCEHFAAAFVVMLRAMDVPARIVTGFQGVDPVPQDGYLVVRNSNAHAWAEYWSERRGWVRVDPTAAVAPERISAGRSLQPAPGAIAGVLGSMNPALWRGLRDGWETLNNRWQQLVLNYSRGQQFDLLKSLGWQQPDWTALGQLIAGLILTATLVLWGWMRWQARPRDAWTRQRQRLVRELRQAGIEASETQGPRRWAELLSDRHGAAAAGLVELLLGLEASRYAASAAPASWTERRLWWQRFAAASRELRAGAR